MPPVSRARKRGAAALIAFALLATFAREGGAQPATVGELNDAIVARVNGRPLLLSELKEIALDLNVPLASLRLDGLEGDGFRTAITAQIDEELLVQEAREEGLQADEGEISRQVEDMIARLVQGLGGREAFHEHLKRSHLSLSTLRNMLAERERRRILSGQLIARRVEIDEVELEAFEKERAEKGETDQLRLAQIFVACPPEERETDEGKARRKKALDAARATGGDPAGFARVAAATTEDPVGRERGGLLGWVDPGVLQPPLGERALAMRVGEVSDPIESDTGFHVLMVLDRRSARDALFSKKFEEERTKLIERLRDEGRIEIYPLAGSSDAAASTAGDGSE